MDVWALVLVEEELSCRAIVDTSPLRRRGRARLCLTFAEEAEIEGLLEPRHLYVGENSVFIAGLTPDSEPVTLI